jgi:multidrug efflux system membrane fusion protein
MALAGCAAAKKPRAPRVPVTVAAARVRSVPLALTVTGSVEAIRTASVGSQVGGTIVRIPFHEGDEVEAGRVLFQLDPRPFTNALAQAKGALAKDRAQATLARLNAARMQSLFDKQLSAQADLDQARATADAAAATVQADSGAELEARLSLEYAAIKAPITGRTGRLLVHEGDYAKPQSADPLVTINQTRPVRVSFAVPVDQVPLVQRYRAQHPRVFVHVPGADSSSTIEGALVFADNAVDPASGTLLLKGEFPNKDGRLVPGQFVDVRLVLHEEPNLLVVPSPAVTSGQQGTFVYVLNADSTVTARNVSVVRSADEMTVLKGGLADGENVVTDGQLRLSPGARVFVQKAARVVP